MNAHEQTDLFGGSVPLEEFELAGHSRRLAQAEREQGQKLTADEAGALIHAARGKHDVDERCQWCQEDGTQALITLNTHRHRINERDRKTAEETPWTCQDCGRENAAGRTLCGGCASSPLDDPEPTPAGLLRDAAPAKPAVPYNEFPAGY